MNPLVETCTVSPRLPVGLADPIAGDLEEVERILTRTLQSSRPHAARLVAHLHHYRGKRLRPMLLLLSARACGQLRPVHHVLGAVVEMIHTATLVHDDVLDNAAVRRHVPTVNARWDNPSSILLGDYLFTHAFHLAATTGDARACEMIGAATNRVCEGELEQIAERGRLTLSEEEYFRIIDGKTAALTACCCRLGAMYSDAGPDVVDSMGRYGRALGIAFQIADDLLDIVGEEQTTGKSLGTDIDQQKATLPVIHILARAGEDAATRLRQILGSQGNRKREALAPYLAESGALGYARQRAEDYARQAREELTCLAPSDSRKVLESLTVRVVNRKC
jgi:octaprenyl-diphosphate synthase